MPSKSKEELAEEMFPYLTPKDTESSRMITNHCNAQASIHRLVFLKGYAAGLESEALKELLRAVDHHGDTPIEMWPSDLRAWADHILQAFTKSGEE